jgi:cytochrome b subunit of formate dehydrogenase
MLGLDIRRAPPPTEQFTAYERIVSFPLWEITLGLIFITGILKAMRYVYPIPGDVLYWTSAVHVGAGVLLGYKLLDHLRYVLAPSRWPLMVAMGTTWVNEHYAQLFHPGWYARVNAEEPGAAQSAPADRTPPVVKARGGVA